MATAEAKKRANDKYKKSEKCQDARINIFLQKTEKAILEEYAASRGLSISRLARLAMRYCMLNSTDLLPYDGDWKTFSAENPQVHLADVDFAAKP